jgi:hypothetical protein
MSTTQDPEFESGGGKTLEGVTVTGFLKKHKKTLVIVALAGVILAAIYYATKSKTV